MKIRVSVKAVRTIGVLLLAFPALGVFAESGGEAGEQSKSPTQATTAPQGQGAEAPLAGTEMCVCSPPLHQQAGGMRTFHCMCGSFECVITQGGNLGPVAQTCR